MGWQLLAGAAATVLVLGCGDSPTLPAHSPSASLEIAPSRTCAITVPTTPRDGDIDAGHRCRLVIAALTALRDPTNAAAAGDIDVARLQCVTVSASAREYSSPPDSVGPGEWSLTFFDSGEGAVMVRIDEATNAVVVTREFCHGAGFSNSLMCTSIPDMPDHLSRS